MRVAVVVCCHTLDRWNDLGEAIDSLRNQSLPPDEIVLVVDNNPPMLSRCIDVFPDIRVVPNESSRGLSGARNCGIAACESELIAFLDDDAIADRDWLRALVDRLNDEQVLGVGTFIEPIWLGARPAWVPDEFLWVFGCSFTGVSSGPDYEVRNLLGAAMVFRRTVFDSVGGFTHKLGRTEGGANLMSCEETELCIRAREAMPSGKFIMTYAARSYHKVPPYRTTLRYFCRRTYAEGVSKAFIAALCGDGALKTERSYAFRLATTVTFKNLKASGAQLSLGPLARIGAAGIGLSCAAFGFLHGRASARGIAGRAHNGPSSSTRVASLDWES